MNIPLPVSRQMLEGYNLFTLEYVQVTVSLSHEERGSLQIWLQCPSSTSSVLAAPRKFDKWVPLSYLCFIRICQCM